MRKGHEIDEFMPLFIYTWLASPAVRAMKDFQRGWYIELLVRAWKNAERPCHLRNDGNRLWMQAGAENKLFFQKHCTLVIEQFRAIEGSEWLVQPDQLDIFNKQIAKHQSYRERGSAGGKARWDSSAIAELKPSYPDARLSSKSKKEKEVVFSSEEFVSRIMSIGFRDSTWRSKGLIERALFEEMEAGVNENELLMSLVNIFNWTEKGVYAPKCCEVIPRWREPRELWERRNGTSQPDGTESKLQRDKKSIARAFDRHRQPADAVNAGNAIVFPKRPDR